AAAGLADGSGDGEEPGSGMNEGAGAAGDDPGAAASESTDSADGAVCGRALFAFATLPPFSTLMSLYEGVRLHDVQNPQTSSAASDNTPPRNKRRTISTVTFSNSPNPRLKTPNSPYQLPRPRPAASCRRGIQVKRRRPSKYG